MSITQRAKDMGVEELVKENRKLKEEIERMKEETRYDIKDINSLYNENQKLKEGARLYREDNKKLRKEVEFRKKQDELDRAERDELEKKRIFSSDEYDLITLASTTPQWELRKK